MRKKLVFAVLSLVLFGSTMFLSQTKKNHKSEKQIAVTKVLDDLNRFAASADFTNYFNLFAEESTFIGTDATEVWNKDEFMKWSKPYFEKGKAWNFTALKRNITFSDDGKYAWFDELLDTQMKICRGSGVLQKIGNSWKIKQYVLSMTIPNEVSNEITTIKSKLEDPLISELKK